MFGVVPIPYPVFFHDHASAPWTGIDWLILGIMALACGMSVFVTYVLLTEHRDFVWWKKRDPDGK